MAKLRVWSGSRWGRTPNPPFEDLFIAASGALFLTGAALVIGPETELDGFPDATNTGLIGTPIGDIAYSSLNARGGLNITESWIASSNGGSRVLELQDITGQLTISVGDFTVRYCRIRSGSNYPVRTNTPEGETHARIEWCEIAATGTTASGVVSDGQRRFELYRCNIYGGHDCVHFKGDCLIEENYIHDQTKASGTHNDAMQHNGSSDALPHGQITIRGNTILGPLNQSTSAIIMGTTQGGMDQILVENNFMSGGSVTFYSFWRKANWPIPPRNVILRNNVFVKDSYTVSAIYGASETSATPSFVHAYSNVFDTGEVIQDREHGYEWYTGSFDW